MRTLLRCLAAIIVLAGLLSGAVAATTPKGAKPSTSEEASPKQIQELMTLLADPKVRNWLEEQSKAEDGKEVATLKHGWRRRTEWWGHVANPAAT